MQQVHADGSLRHAEKRRIGTCEFANRIARISLDAYESCVPLSYREDNKQTCVAAIVAHFKAPCVNNSKEHKNEQSIEQWEKVECSKQNDNLQVMGLGVGTKFLPDAIVKEEQQDANNIGGKSTGERNNNNYGMRIRDCHAEILARRAFRRQLALEIFQDLKNEKSEKCKNVNQSYRPIIERVDCSKINKNDEETINSHAPKVQYRLRPDVTLHFYASSAPCGNATLKKFTKMEKEKFDASLGPDEWPQRKHEPIAAHSLRLGQFALLVKRDTSSSQVDHQSQGSIDDNGQCMTISTPHEINRLKTTTSTGQETTKHGLDTTSAETQQNNKKGKKKPKMWPCNEDDTWCPPSCSITNFNKGTIHSCSDKICRWNCLGLQGSLLTSVLEAPLYMTTLTVGRKFSRAICQRAVCCRADGFRARKESEVDGNETAVGPFRLNHPVLMETSVYMDESGTHKMGGIKTIGQDASFDSNLCWVWWPNKTRQYEYMADCIDGKTGLVVHYSENANAGAMEQEEITVSEVSTASMCKITMQILEHSADNGTITQSSRACPSTLSGMRSLKQQLSHSYEEAKDDLFRHRTFRNWSCRDCRPK